MATGKVLTGAGLRGQVAGKTALSTVGKTGSGLTYRGYDVKDLAANCSFEEVAHLILKGELPSSTELSAYKAKLKSMRSLPQALKDVLAAEPVFDKVSHATGKRLPFYRLNEVAQLGLELKVINENEAEQLRVAETGRLFAINVDDFEPEYLAADKSLTQQGAGATATDKKDKAA